MSNHEQTKPCARETHEVHNSVIGEIIVPELPSPVQDAAPAQYQSPSNVQDRRNVAGKEEEEHVLEDGLRVRNQRQIAAAFHLVIRLLQVYNDARARKGRPRDARHIARRACRLLTGAGRTPTLHKARAGAHATQTPVRKYLRAAG